MASYKDLGNNKYKIYVELGYNDAGKRIRKTKTVVAKSQRALNKAVTEFEIEARETKNVYLDNITFKKFYEKHFKPIYLSKLKVSTRNLYKDNENFILAYFKDMRMNKIKPLHVENFLDNEEKEGRKSLDKKHIFLKSVFERALEWEVIESNPAKKVKIRKPTSSKREIQHFTKEQVKFLLSELDNKATKKLNMQAKLSLLCGLRRGEIMALCIEDIDFDKKTISITKNLQIEVGTNKKILQTPKNGKSRIVPINKTLEQDLFTYVLSIKKLKLSMGDLWVQQKGLDNKDITYLFSNERGLPQTTKSVSSAWINFMKNVKLPYLNFHGLRHTFATILVQSNVNINIVQELLGHSDIRVTINKYTHAENEDLAKGVQAIDNIL